MLTGGLANTSFVGLPMIDTFYGPQFLGLGILIDQLGSYFVLSTLGILVASLYSSGSGQSISTKAVIRKIVYERPGQRVQLKADHSKKKFGGYNGTQSYHFLKGEPSLGPRCC
jgi:hypothetical protein